MSTIVITTDQAVRLFQDLRVLDAGIDEEHGTWWDFSGGLRLWLRGAATWVVGVTDEPRSDKPGIEVWVR